MRLLDAVNFILPKLGEHPVTSLDIAHPTLGVILPTIEKQLDLLLNPGWWFNRLPDYEAHPDIDGGITLGTNTLGFWPACEEAVLRGRRLFNRATGSYTWDGPVRGELIQRIPFEELPESAAMAVMYDALIVAYLEDIGQEQVVSSWAALSTESKGNLMAEHLRQMRLSTRRSPRWRRYMSSLRT